MPQVMKRLATTAVAGVLRNDAAILTCNDPIGVGVDLHGPSNRTGFHRVFVPVELNQAGLSTPRPQRVKSIEPATIRDQMRPFRLKNVPDNLAPTLRVRMSLARAKHLSVSHAFSSS